MDYPGKVISKNAVVPSQTSASGVWTLDDAAAAVESNTWPIAGVPNPISRSLRFNSADTAYLNRTFSTPTSQNIWSFSCWLKRSSLADQQFIFWAGTSATNDCALYFTSSDQIGWFTNNGVSVNSTSTAVFRDPSAWYHIVAIANSTTMNVYVNNQQIITNAGMTNNTINSAIAHCIGQDVQTSGNEFSGYMTEINFIDGQALTPSDFGLTDPQTGAWIPKKYTGTYGTNGFYLNFSDNASTAALGTDYSGNNNTWTTNNFSVTAGSGNDSMTDVPTPWTVYNTTGDVGGVVRGNYATFNPLISSSYQTTSDGNLTSKSNTSTDSGAAYSTITTGTSGLWYCEFTANTSAGGGYPIIGTWDTSIALPSGNGGTYLPGASGAATGYMSSGNKYILGASSAYGASYSTNDVIGVAIDCTNGAIYFSKNGVFQNSGVPTSGASKTGAANTWTGGTKEFLIGIGSFTSGNGADVNFGQRPFAYTPPAGFLSLCTTNLPTPTILDGTDYFNTVLYTGNGSTLAVTGVGFQPDFVWVKARSLAYSNYLYDSVRGTGTSKSLISDATAAEGAGSANANLTSFDSSGFSLGTTSGTNGMNANAGTFVSWNWKANGTPAVTNTDGTITSSISVNTTSGFSIVTYTGNGTSGATVGHGLGVAPNMIIVKRRDGGTNSWNVQHQSVNYNSVLFLDLTSEATVSSNFNSTGPTSSVFYLGSSDGTNGSGGTKTYVAYCFAAIPGFSAFGSYTGNGSTDGPFVYTGFRPAFVLVKRTDSTADWVIIDSARNTYNAAGNFLYPNSSAAEDITDRIDFISNGFKLRTSSGPNNSGSTWIYAAFATNPFKYSNAR